MDTYSSLQSASCATRQLFTVQTIWFRTLYVFFVIHHGSREIVHACVTANPTAGWLAQQMTQARDPDRDPPHYLIHDRDGRYGAAFNRRVRSLGMNQIRTPVRAPKANAIAERWVRTVRAECLDHRLALGQQHLQRLIDEYVAYYNDWRPHRSQDQRAPRRRRRLELEWRNRIVAEPFLAGSTMSIDSRRRSGRLDRIFAPFRHRFGCGKTLIISIASDFSMMSNILEILRQLAACWKETGDS